MSCGRLIGQLTDYYERAWLSRMSYVIVSNLSLSVFSVSVCVCCVCVSAVCQLVGHRLGRGRTFSHRARNERVEYRVVRDRCLGQVQRTAAGAALVTAPPAWSSAHQQAPLTVRQTPSHRLKPADTCIAVPDHAIAIVSLSVRLSTRWLNYGRFWITFFFFLGCVSGSKGYGPGTAGNGLRRVIL